MTAQLVCIVVVTQNTILCHMIFIGVTWVNMSETGFAAVHHVFGLSPSNPPHGPMQLRVHQYPFHTLGVDYVGELPVSPTGNKLDSLLLVLPLFLITFRCQSLVSLYKTCY